MNRAGAPFMTEAVKAEAAARITAVAKAMTEGRFGDDKVFVSHLYRAVYAAETGFVETLEFFKEALLMLHCERYLTLSRADLVEAMDPRDVGESEIRHHGAVFNFLKVF